ncbi:MAG: double-strand break repair protein AddB [Nitratireductor sp.]
MPHAATRQSAAGRLFNIAPGPGFLAKLADALVGGKLVPGFCPVDNPLLLASATVYLPTRRAARAFSGEIVRALGGQAALMPTIRTLGDSSEDEFSFPADEGMKLKPAAGELMRRLTLSKFVLAWTGALSKASRELIGDMDIVIPSSTADAIRMSGDLARLIDQMETEEIDWKMLEGLAGPDHAKWWELTTDFLKIVVDAWPQHLEGLGLADPSIRRKDILDLRSRRLAEAIVAGKTSGPVIAAGSTGSIPATARFLKTIVSHPEGAVVLPGIDRSMEQHVWEQLAKGGSEAELAMLSSHPQAGLAKLLSLLGVERGSIADVGETSAAIARRNTMVALALLPATQTAAWSETAADSAGALDGVAIVEAPGEREEALAIAVALRMAIADQTKTAALVTPDRALAGRVAGELQRFGITVDDSGGVPLAASRAGRLALLLASVICGNGDNVRLAALMKDPLFDQLVVALPHIGAGEPARLLELAVIRDSLELPLIGSLQNAVAAAKERLQRPGHFHPQLKKIDDLHWQAMDRLASQFDLACAPLADRVTDRQTLIPLASLMAGLRGTITNLLGEAAIQAHGNIEGWGKLIGMFDAFDRLDLDSGSDVSIRTGEFADVLSAVMSGHVVHSQRPAHPRVFIWGPLEARLQSVDVVVLGGLNEQTWPQAARNDPFLNRPMRGEIGLSLPERRIGQSAHDFQQLIGMENVVLTRSLKSGNAPAIASRWLQRLEILAGKDAAKAMKARGEKYLRIAALADQRVREPVRDTRPNPKPPVELRPVSLSITEIETWIRDPYVIHARHILGLHPLPPLEREGDDPALRGTLYHKILADHVSGRRPGETRKEAGIRLEALTRQIFEKEAIPAAIAATWLPRFLEIGQLFLDWDEARLGTIARSLCETRGEIDVGLDGFSLRGRADRIDILKDGSAVVFDYKTGKSPSLEQARTLSPQMALEGKMAQLGAFGLEPGTQISELAFIRLRVEKELKVDSLSGGKNPPPIETQMADAWVKLAGLVAAYRDPARGYLSRYAPFQQNRMDGDYDHLARVREWSIGGDDDNG